MKSNRQRRTEIRKKRLKSAERIAKDHEKYMVESGRWQLVEVSKLNLGNPYPLPHKYYKNIEFDCVDCGNEEVWTAAQQKWWYEEAKGDYFTTAIRCRECRKKERERKEEARKASMEGMIRKNEKPT